MIPSLTDQPISVMTIDWPYLQVDRLNILSCHFDSKIL